MSIPPNLHKQKYKVKEWFIQSGIHTIDSPECKTYECTFKQKRRFVSSVDGKNNQCLGVWHNTGNGWQLYVSIDKNDNDCFIITPTKISENKKVTEMDGINIEAGTSKNLLFKLMNAMYHAMSPNLKKYMSNIYNSINSSFRKNIINQNLGVSHITFERIS